MANNKLIDFFRSLKITYTAYNFIHSKKLAHNKAPYRQAGLRKLLFESISSKDFKNFPQGDIPWLDKDISPEEIQKKVQASSFSEGTKEALLSWKENGYLILKNFFSEEEADAVNKEIEALLASKKIAFTLGNKIMFANKQSELIKDISTQKKITELLSFILGKKVIPFQTINFITGSQQHAHSDSIHMTTYPMGYLIAVWIALEDIDETQGALSYYPGSHKLPYVLNEDYERGGNKLSVGADNNYLKYEEKIAEVLQQHAISKKIFATKKGDMLVWHANLIHGGEKITKPESTRKSMVIHYFAEDVIKYHEITERPSLLED
ncbi:MAG: phytanoyl-CoA dioxygenase family protein [Bacteroidetes bacterium]|nr:phytanoyl-CoA dioxygenase family protein [Bacteroidota bacterium]